ncbi:MAG TPA: heterodisulfide reductase-related iron-sulfur binding cluster [Candidatus Binatia bacterium]
MTSHALGAAPDPQALSSCVHCGLCLSSCPTYVELGTEADSPRGRIHLMRALAEGRLAPTTEATRHLDTCLGCRACESACPSGVPYGELIEAARPWVEERRALPGRLARRALGAALTRPSLRRTLLVPVRAVAGAAWLRTLARHVPSSWTSYAAALRPLRPAPPPLPRVIEPEGEVRGEALLLTGCVAHDLFPHTNAAIARLLARAGVRVRVPQSQGCCGALSLHLGHETRARTLARDVLTLAALHPTDWVVATAAGCGALLRDYARLLPDDPAAADLARRARDPLALLDELGLPPAPHPLARTVAVHDPCHLAHAQGVRAEVRRLLGAIPGLRLVELPESDVCCGSAGTYNLTEPGIAGRLLERKLQRIAESGADIVAAANPGCLLQIRAGALRRRLPVAIEHPIDLLATAHGVHA